ncbi:MAG: DUF402 domain-containing protein [Clostridiales bacterium]|jgi:hypothetical protein|nr:DUF402 domain-containing protein [Clostridiales bacterium]
MDNEQPKLYRRRYIPNECVCLKDDHIIYFDKNIILTQWTTLKPRSDFDHGCSCFYIHEGFKISKFYDKSGHFLYHYCDVVESIYNEKENSYVFNDLLADVIIYENGFVEVLDIGEIAIATAEHMITQEQMMNALKTLDKLLNLIYSGKLAELTEPMNMLQRV